MIEIQNIHKSFQNKSVLNGIDLDIPKGQTTVIVGCSGCGKTVLLRSIIGLEVPDRGCILIDGEDLTQMNKKALYRMRMKFGMLFQGAALFDSMSVLENVGLPLREHTRLTSAEIRKKVAEKLELVGLPHMEDKMPAELSGGMKKRVGLARAIVMEPEYVLFDEPTTGLDPIMSDNINQLILNTTHELNVTSIMVTHDMKSAFAVGNYIAMICEGDIVFRGTTQAFQDSRIPVVRQFIEGKSK